jgi:hypothetical protein
MTDPRPQGVNTKAQPDRPPSVVGSNDDDERYASCDGRPLILSWTINRHLFYTFEVDIDEAERIVPAPLQVVELRPSVALMSVGVLRYEPGHFGPGSPVFLEVVGAIHVSPDLSTDMPVPTMTFSTFQVWSDSPDFVANEDDTLYTPTRLASLEARFTEDGLGVEAWDEDGPILAMPSAHTEPRWVHKEMWGQHFTNTKGLQHGSGTDASSNTRSDCRAGVSTPTPSGRDWTSAACGAPTAPCCRSPAPSVTSASTP